MRKKNQLFVIKKKKKAVGLYIQQVIATIFYLTKESWMINVGSNLKVVGGGGVLNHETKEKSIFSIFDPHILSIIANKKPKKFVAKPPPLTSFDAQIYS